MFVRGTKFPLLLLAGILAVSAPALAQHPGGGGMGPGGGGMGGPGGMGNRPMGSGGMGGSPMSGDYGSMHRGGPPPNGDQPSTVSSMRNRASFASAIEFRSPSLHCGSLARRAISSSRLNRMSGSRRARDSRVPEPLVPEPLVPPVLVPPLLVPLPLPLPEPALAPELASLPPPPQPAIRMPADKAARKRAGRLALAMDRYVNSLSP